MTTIKKTVTIARPKVELERQWERFKRGKGKAVQGAGVRWVELRHDRGTELHLAYDHDLPGGAPVEAAASLAGKVVGTDPHQRLESALRGFKALMEAGEVPTTEGQPSGRRADQRKARKRKAA